MQKQLNDLIDRAKKINESRLRISSPGIDLACLENVEKRLGIVLPIDMKEIITHISYTLISTFEFFCLNSGDIDFDSIIFNNLTLRSDYAFESTQKSDLSKILVLADNDGGSVFMITQNDANKSTPIIWCDAGDMYWYSINGQFPHPHDEWPSFTDFFEYLVEQEEAMLKEQAK